MAPSTVPAPTRLQSSFSASPRFLEALTVAERVSAWRGRPEEVPEAFDPQLAQRRLEVWRAQPPFDRDGFLTRRLAADGLDATGWERLLGEVPEALARRLETPPGWLSFLDAAFADPQSPSLPELSELPGGPVQLVPFLNLAAPLIDRGIAQLREGVRDLEGRYPSLPFDPAGIVNLLYPVLARRLVIMVGRTLTLELHVAGHRGQLQGDSPEARFSSFATSLLDQKTAAGLLEEYPVLARQIVVAVQNWVDFSRDLLTHLAEDWPAVERLFAPAEEAGRVVSLRGGMGDSHRGGRSVVILHTDAGLKVVYKPRSLAVDAAFQNLLAWLNLRGAAPPLLPVKILDRGTHGFMEYVTPTPCTRVEEVERFYRRQGGYLALFHLLDATDFHHENLIAVGEHPVPVDLEALFHPPHHAPHLTPDDPLYAGEALLRSVLRVGLLPLRIWGDEEYEGMDISGLAARGGQAVRDGLLDVDEAGTDRMRFVRRILNLPGAANRPTLEGEEVELTEFRGEVIDGFSEMYRLLLRHRDELLAPDGPLRAFAETEVRVILRPTRAYAMLLGESFHPDFLRSAIDRDRWFDRLWMGVAERPYLEQLTPHEKGALENIDVPAWSARPGSRDLWTDAGVRLPGFLGESGLARVERRFRLWDEEDLRREGWLVRTTLDSVELLSGEAKAEGYPLAEADREATWERLLAGALDLAGHLEELAFRDESREAWWYDFEPVGQDLWTLQSAGPSLYSGLPGIVLFLAHLAALTGNSQVEDLGRAAFRAWRRMTETPFETTVGAFSGRSGGLYVLAHLHTLWEEPSLGPFAEGILDLLPPAIEEDRNLDVIGGIAGCLLALLAFHRTTGSERARELALRCGERLLETSRPMPVGRGWVTPMAERPLAGFSHGAAGIARALFELSAVSGEERFASAAREGIAYERSVFVAEEGNWPDLRDGRGKSFLVAWCHGAPGIGLSRLLALPHLDDEVTWGEIAVAIETTLRKGLGMNLSLCHGDLGQLDFLLQAARALGDSELEGRVYRLAAGVLGVIEERGWPCGMARGAEPPGLMMGLAGIGYGLLRLAAPERVPSVLALAASPSV